MLYRRSSERMYLWCAGWFAWFIKMNRAIYCTISRAMSLLASVVIKKSIGDHCANVISLSSTVIFRSWYCYVNVRQAVVWTTWYGSKGCIWAVPGEYSSGGWPDDGVRCEEISHTLCLHNDSSSVACLSTRGIDDYVLWIAIDTGQCSPAIWSCMRISEVRTHWRSNEGFRKTNLVSQSMMRATSWDRSNRYTFLSKIRRV